MTSGDEVRKLAQLARIRIEDADIEVFSKEFESILGYAGQLEALNVTSAPDLAPPVRNAFRKDEDPHPEGVHTEKLSGQFPERDGNSLKVKQVISHD